MRLPSTAFVLLVVLVTAIASGLAFSPQNAGTAAFWLLATSPTCVLAVLAAAWARREGLLAEWLAPRWGDFSSGVAAAAVLFLLAWGASRVLAPTGSPREIWLVSLYGQIGDPRWLQAHALVVAAVIAVAALSEEIVWRGLVCELLAERFGSRTAWVWAAALYGLSFLPTMWSLRAASGKAGGLDPLLPMAALSGGLLWGGLARRRGGLVPSALGHALFDWAVVMMFPLWGVHRW